MKKASPKQQQWKKNKQFKIKKKESRLKKKSIRVVTPDSTPVTTEQAKKTQKIRMVVAPEYFSLTNDNHREKLLNFIKKIKNNLSQGYKVDISFDETHTLVTSGTLWMVAKLEKLIYSYPNKISCNYPEDNTVHQLLQHIGFLKKLGLPEKMTEIDSDIVRHWHYISGTTTDDVSHFDKIFKCVAVPEEFSDGLYDSMSEAVTNTIQHAYDDDEIKEWRMFAQKKDGKLDIAICDLGVGIPKSLKQKPEIKKWLTSPIQSARKNRDSYLLEVAIQSTRSKTKLSHRGKGLRDMLTYAKSVKVGGFRILSGKGAFDYSSSKKLKINKQFKSQINGTLIEWQIPLENNHDK